MKSIWYYIKTLPERIVRVIERRKFKNSAEPWVSIIGNVDPTKGMKLDLDWNEAFIQYLRKSGIPGIKDEEVVACWITHLHSQMMEGLDG